MSDPTIPALPDAVAVANPSATGAATPAPGPLGPLPGLLAAAGEDPSNLSRLNEVLDTATRHCRRLVNSRVARVWLARRGGRRLVTREPGGEGRPMVEHRIRRGEGLAGHVLATGATLRLKPGDPRPVVKGALPECTSALVVPLFRRGQTFAVIECLDRQGPGAASGFTDEDVDRLEVAAESIAFALDHALLSEETVRRSLEKEVLLEVAKTLSAPLEVDEVIAAILESLRQVVAYDAAAVYLLDRRTQALERVAAVGYPAGTDEAFGLRVGEGLSGWVAKTGEAVIVADVRNDPRYVAARPGTRSEIAAPLQVRGRTIGVFNLESDQEDAYHEGHLEMLGGFASQAAVAVERARMTRDLLEQRRLERELAIAREIQASFLPKSAPSVPGFELAGTARTHAQVGGDYYDFIRVSEGRLGLAIADASGKGIPAAILMAGFRMSLLAEIRNEFAIRAVMRKVNSLLHESTDRDKFVTAFYGLLDWRNGVLTFSNAGHNPPILVRAGGRLEHLTEGGVALGVLPSAQYEDRPVAFHPGDVLLLYTDGVSEAENVSGEQFGQARLEQTLAGLVGGTAEHILEGIVDAVVTWAGERGQTDDLTLVVVRALPATPGA